MTSEARIVVGIDGSAPADEALRWAADEAELRRAPLEVVLVWEFALVPYYLAPSDPAPPQALADAAARRLDEAVQEHVPDGVEVIRSLVEGRPAASLVSAAQGAQLLVVGSRGLGGFSGLLLGSVSLHCATHAPCAVTIVRPTE